MDLSDELSRAAFEGNVEQVRRLLDAGAAIDADGELWNALHCAIENQHVDCVRFLISRGADVEHRAMGNLSPLAHAVDIAIDGTHQRGREPGEEPTDIISLLVDAGADLAPGLAVARGYESASIIAFLSNAMKRRAG